MGRRRPDGSIDSTIKLSNLAPGEQFAYVFDFGDRWNGDDGESPQPKRPARLLTDLPPILPWWGPQRR
jgi:hypothetical protein